MVLDHSLEAPVESSCAKGSAQFTPRQSLLFVPSPSVFGHLQITASLAIVPVVFCFHRSSRRIDGRMHTLREQSPIPRATYDIWPPVNGISDTWQRSIFSNKGRYCRFRFTIPPLPPPLDRKAQAEKPVVRRGRKSKLSERVSMSKLPQDCSGSSSSSWVCCCWWSPPPKSISCCSTMLYTLALSSVKTRLVLRSSSRRPSRICVVGWFAMVSRTEASC